MNSNYVYLISSLPMLCFGINVGISFAAFIEKCQQFASKEDFNILNNLPEIASDIKRNNPYPIINRLLSFEIMLRNELVKIRASRKKIDPTKYLRLEDSYDASIVHIAQAAHRNPSSLEAEKFLDLERWNFLDELLVGHYFDLEFLIIYGYKLKILERWQKIETADKSKLLDEVLNKI